MNIHEIVSSSAKRQFADKQFWNEVFKEARTTKPVRINKGIIEWDESTTKRFLSEAGEASAAIQRIGFRGDWFGVIYTEANGQKTVGAFPSREAANRARREFESSGRMFRGNPSSAPDNVKTWVTTQQQKIRLAGIKAQRAARVKQFLEGPKASRALRILRPILVVLGAWNIVGEYFEDIYLLVGEIIEATSSGDLQEAQSKQTVLANYLEHETGRVFFRVMVLFVGALLVARTARAIVSKLMWAMRIGSLATGPGAIVAWTLTFIIEGGMWAMLSTQWGQEKIRTAFLWIMENVWPSAAGLFVEEAANDQEAEPTMADRLRTDTEKTVGDVIEGFGNIDQSELQDMKDDVESWAAQQGDPADTDRSNPSTTPADRVTPGRTVAPVVPGNVQQNLNSLEW